MQDENSINTFQLIAIKNPFDLSSRVTRTVLYEGKTVQAYANDLFPEIPPDFDLVSSVDGGIVDPEITIPHIGCYVVFCLVPRDRDMGRMLAQLGLIVLSIWVPTGITSPFWAGMASAGILVAGNLIINAILPIKLEDADSESASPSYGWGNVNETEEGATSPVIYGTVKVLPYLIGKYMRSYWQGGRNTPDKQRLNLLYQLADHSLDSIEDIQINGNAYTGYDDVAVTKRYGTNNQAVIPYFNDTHEQTTANIKFSLDWLEVNVPGSENTGIAVGMVFPNGLYHINRHGDYRPQSVLCCVQYSLQSKNSWTTITNGLFEASEPTAIRWHKEVHGLTAGAYKVRFKTDKLSEPDRPSMKDQYLEYLSGITEDDFRYPGKSLLAISAIATDQLSGGLPTVSCVCTRNYVPVHTGAGWEDKPANNPAWVCYDMLVNDEYGGGVSYTKMIYADFLAWANFCTTNGYTCNIVFDVTTTFPEALAKASLMGRGHIVQKGIYFTVIIDKQDDPVQLFGMGNIIEGTFKQSYLGKNGRANAIEVTYFDSSVDYEKRSFELRTSDFDSTNPEIEKLALVLYGATDRDSAIKHAKFMLNCNEHLIRSVEFEVWVDALVANIGNVIYVSHDVPQWGYSGQVVSATLNTVTIDREVTLTPGTTYHILVRHYNDDDLEEVAIATPGIETTTDELTLSGSWDQIPQADDVYAFGVVAAVAKPFRITTLTRTHEQRRRINALEYIAAVYDDSAEVPDYSYTDLVPYAEGLLATEVYRKEGGVVVAFVSLAWRGFGLIYLYMKEDTADRWRLVSTHSGDNWAEIRNLEPGKTYYFAVSVTANPADGEVTSLTFKGWTAPFYVWAVSGLQMVGQGNSTVWQNKDLKLTWNLSSDTFPDEADGETDGAGSYYPMSEFGGYRAQILNSTGTLRREIVQVENFYNYSYELNSEDGSGTPSPNLIIKVWARTRYGKESDSPAMISVSNPSPSAPSGLTATPYMKGVLFAWYKNTEIDFSHYSLRLKVEDDDWSDWMDITGVEKVRSLTEAEEAEHTSEATIYMEIKSVDTFGNESSTVNSSAATFGLNIQPTDISDFAITASKIFTKIPILEGDSWMDDSPSEGYISWNTHTVYYNGAAYSISSRSTNLKYVYWINGEAGYGSSNANPALSDGDFIIATNTDGAHDLAWNAIANQVIGSAYIQLAAIQNAHILDLDADKIMTGTLTGIEIIGNTIKTLAQSGEKAVHITTDGIALHVTSNVGKWGTAKWGDGTKYGTGVLAYVHHRSQIVPFFIASEQTVGDFHFYNRGSDPTGAAVVGDVCVVNGVLKICTNAGTPGTWAVVGDQAAP